MEFTIEKLPEVEGDERPQPRCVFSFPAQESIHDVRHWLKRHQDDCTIKHLCRELSKDDLDSEGVWFMAMIELDQYLQSLHSISDNDSSTEED